MSEEEIALIPLISPIENDKSDYLEDGFKHYQDNAKRSKIRALFLRVSRIRLRFKFSKLRYNLKRINCLKSEEDEEIIMDVQRHKSIDIGVGLARKMSLFLFTRKSVCLHPYHPFTPPQTTRKINLFNKERHN